MSETAPVGHRHCTPREASTVTRIESTAMIDVVFADQDDGREIAQLYQQMPLASQVALLQVA